MIIRPNICPDIRRGIGRMMIRPLRPPSNQAPPRRTSKTIGSIVRGFKIGVTRWMRGNDFDGPVWQRGYYEHIIREEESLNRIRQYILDNPARWATDHDNLAVGGIETELPWLD